MPARDWTPCNNAVRQKAFRPWPLKKQERGLAVKSSSGGRQALANGTALLDQVNLRLLELLQQDPRLTMAELARRVGMSAPAVTAPLPPRDPGGGHAGDRLDIDPKALGLPICAYVRVRPGPRQLERIADLAIATPQVIEC